MMHEVPGAEGGGEGKEEKGLFRVVRGVRLCSAVLHVWGKGILRFFFPYETVFARG
jgi:hypothetical protein